MSATNHFVTRSVRLLLTAVLAIPWLMVAAGPTAAQPDTATITILHGLPDFTADVYVNGELTLDGFEPKSATQALSLPAGDYDVAIRDVGSDPNSDPVLQATITLKGGTNYSAIAHLSGDGRPALDVFQNDLSKIPAGRSRLVVRNTAQSPLLDVRLDGKAAFRGLAPGSEATKSRRTSSYMLDAVDAGDGSQLVAATPVDLREGAATIVYVVGSAADQSLDFMVQDITGLGTDPSVFAGSGGRAAPQGFPMWAAALLVVLAAVAVGSVVALRKGR